MISIIAAEMAVVLLGGLSHAQMYGLASYPVQKELDSIRQAAQELQQKTAQKNDPLQQAAAEAMEAAEQLRVPLNIRPEPLTAVALLGKWDIVFEAATNAQGTILHQEYQEDGKARMLFLDKQGRKKLIGGEAKFLCEARGSLTLDNSDSKQSFDLLPIRANSIYSRLFYPKKPAQGQWEFSAPAALKMRGDNFSRDVIVIKEGDVLYLVGRRPEDQGVLLIKLVKK